MPLPRFDCCMVTYITVNKNQRFVCVGAVCGSQLFRVQWEGGGFWFPSRYRQTNSAMVVFDGGDGERGDNARVKRDLQCGLD